MRDRRDHEGRRHRLRGPRLQGRRDEERGDAGLFYAGAALCGLLPHRLSPPASVSLSPSNTLAKTAPYTRANGSARPSEDRSARAYLDHGSPSAATAHVAVRGGGRVGGVPCAAAARAAPSASRRRRTSAARGATTTTVARAGGRAACRTTAAAARAAPPDVVSRARSLDSESPRCRYDDDLGSAAAGAGARAGAGSGASIGFIPAGARPAPSSARPAGPARGGAPPPGASGREPRRVALARRATAASLALVLDQLDQLELASRRLLRVREARLARGAPAPNLPLVRRPTAPGRRLDGAPQASACQLPSRLHRAAARPGGSRRFWASRSLLVSPAAARQ